MDRLVKRMRLHKIRPPVVYQCALLQRRLAKDGIESEIVQGFACIGGGCCRHYWVESDGTQMDIGTAMGLRDVPQLLTLSRTPDGQRFDQDEESQKIVLANDTHYELYKTDPRRFWLESPVRNIIA